MAGTVGRLTGKPGVALTIKGPGGQPGPRPGGVVHESFPVALSEAYLPIAAVPRAQATDHATLAALVTKAVRLLSKRSGVPGRAPWPAPSSRAGAGATGAVLIDAAPLPVATAPATKL